MQIKILCLVLLISMGHPEGIFTLYPLANDYFDIIYEIKHVSNSSKLSSQDSSIFLRVYCKDHNVVSVSLTPTLEFSEEPRFPIYSRQSKIIPKFQQEIYTFLSSCNVEVKAHPRKNSIVQIIRRDNKEPIFQLSDVILSKGHNQFNIIDKSTKWGLGERFQQKFRVTDGTWTIWNRDKPWQIDHGRKGRSSSTYGHQPIYLARQTKDGYTHLTYFKNTHGILVQTTEDSNKLTYNSIGGNIHFLIFVGDKNPQKTLQKYHDFIGGIHIPPFWALGWHQCRWGYKNINMLTQIILRYKKNDLPIDTIWNDLDYMKNKAIFTIDESTYPSSSLKSLLEENSLHWIPLIDVGVSLLDKESMEEGKKLDVFLKSVTKPNEYYIGQVWPGKVHFVDYLHPNASQFWKKQLNRLYKKVPFSGVWLDMNEPSNFRGNQPVTEYYQIQQSESINQMTIDVNLKHYSTFDKNNPLTHWQVHSYYGHTSTVPTFDFLKEHGRPFIISRSNSVGTGRYAGHWTGDNSATWAFMRLSISGNFLYQIFGIQMVGADICGFNGDTTEKLCSRWTQLGSLYPFARNHNQDIAKDQEPYALGDNVLKTAQISIKQRYSLLKQLYSILIDLNGKGSFFRPVYFEFYDDQNGLNLETIQTEFLLGRYLLSAPIVEQGKDHRSVYFPGNGVWYCLEYDMDQPGLYRKQNVQKSINKNKRNNYEGGKSEEVVNKITTSPPLFLRSGFMIFSNKPQQRSRFLNNKFYATAALNSEGVAINRFLTIENYQNETVLGKCIEKKQCLTRFELKKSPGAAIQFYLNWVFEGKPQVFGQIELTTITVWEGDKQWTSKDSIKIDKPTGKLIVKLQETQSKVQEAQSKDLENQQKYLEKQSKVQETQRKAQETPS